MFALTLIVHIFVGSTIAGSAIIAALTLGFDTATPIIATGLAGYALSFPVSWYIAKSIRETVKTT